MIEKQPPAKPATIYDVADRAGVSKSLVSLVLRGATNVSPARRELVEKAIKELGYRPSRFAQQLASSNSRSIGVVITDYKNLSYLSFLKGLREIFDDAGYQVIISDLHRSQNFAEDPIDAFMSLKVDGIVLATEAAGLHFEQLDVPVVMIGNRATKATNADVVFNDDYEGTRLALEHLVQFGHKRIAHISGVGGVANIRRQAFLKLVKEFEIEGEVYGLGEPTTEIGGYLGTMEMLKSGKQFTAIFAANDYMAAGAMSALKEHGLSVPEDISIVGYDDSPIASDFLLKLTTVDEQGIPVGRQTASLLLERIGGTGQYSPKQILIKPTLISRSSVSSPKK
jgi:DNA-binding LacI/PurR family transcriptional regulator